MDKGEKIQYPVTAETMHKYAESIFAPIRRGECVTTVWVPMAGRRMWNKFVIEHIDLFEKELPGFNKYILVYIEPLDLTEETLSGYVRLMGKSFIEACEKNSECRDFAKKGEIEKILDDDNASYSKLLETLKILLNKISNSGLEVIFFLGEFDELNFANSVLYKNLKSIWSQMYPKLHYIFLTMTDPTTPESTERLGELNAAALQNLVFVSLLQDKDVDHVINFWTERLGVRLTDSERVLVKRLCGGMPYLISASVRIVSNLDGSDRDLEMIEGILSSHYETISAVRRIYKLRSPREKEVLKKILAKEKISDKTSLDRLERLVKLGLVKKTEGGNYGYKFFGELFEQVIGGQDVADDNKNMKVSSDSLCLDEATGTLLFSGKPIDEKFTRQEYTVVKFLLNESGKLRSRDDIGEALWGKQSYEKYSDWAIDQLMSKIRRKLDSLNTKSRLVTIRGRGYKIVSD